MTEHLTDAERESLLCDCDSKGDTGTHWWACASLTPARVTKYAAIRVNTDEMTERVERIIAARLEQQREALAAAIEQSARDADVEMIVVSGAFVRRWPFASQHLRDAARIVREYGDGA